MTLEDIALRLDRMEAILEDIQHPHLKGSVPATLKQWKEGVWRTLITRAGYPARVLRVHDENPDFADAPFHGFYEKGTLAIDTCWGPDGKNSNPDLDLFVRK